MRRLKAWLRRIAGGSDRESQLREDEVSGGGVARLRDDIDSGRTGDKVAAPDPAAAPLGTDDEAAGTPPRAEEVEFARRQERRQ